MSPTFIRILVPILVASLLISRSASQHVGVANIKEPPISENDQAIWFAYYQDQFDAFKGEVPSPGAQYPESATQGYKQAKDEWSKQVRNARGRTVFAYMCAGVGCGVAVVLVLTNLPKHEEQHTW